MRRICRHIYKFRCFRRGVKERRALDSPHDDGDFLVWKLSDVHVRGGIRFGESAGEKVWQLVELAELPLCERCIGSATDG